MARMELLLRRRERRCVAKVVSEISVSLIAVKTLLAGGACCCFSVVLLLLLLLSSEEAMTTAAFFSLFDK